MPQFLFKCFKHLALIGVIVFCYIVAYDHVLAKRFGPNTKKQISLSFDKAFSRDYSVLILGNSRMYRGVNPDKFSSPTYNFAHDDDSFNQMYYKLLLINKHKHIKALVVGVDYFSFSYIADHRNYVYGDLLGPDYLRDYYEYKNPIFVTTVHFFESIRQRINNYLGFDRTKLFIRSILFGANVDVPRLKENGQYLYPGKAKASDSIERKYSITDIQKRYFEAIIDHCRKTDIRLYLVMPPVRDNELKNYPQKIIDDFHRYFSSFEGVTFIDFSTSDQFQLEDYTDITHLNPEAADRFSILLNEEFTKTTTLLVSNPED